MLGLSTIAEAQAQGGSGASVNFWLSLRNSVIIATVITIGQVGVLRDGRLRVLPAPLAGPGLWCSALFLAALMVPPIFTAIPNFLLIKQLGSDQHPDRASSCRSSS